MANSKKKCRILGFIGVFFLLIGVVSLLLHARFDSFDATTGFVQDTLYLPLAFLSFFIGLLFLAAALIFYFMTKKEGIKNVDFPN